MNNLMFIPKKIHVGYQNRDSTYTGQLAYVIYEDEKGKLRKETSWNSWRDQKIDPNVFENNPTEGFVLNKGVGGVKNSYSSWNPRNEYIRVYDPRNFEIEISVANLLFILQECTSTKGKGLEGEFVYAMDGTSLILLPVSCKEYKDSLSYSKNRGKKVSKGDMQEGCLYLNKDMKTLMYLGRFLCKPLQGYIETQELLSEASKKYHVFYDEDSCEYLFEKGFTKLTEKITSEPEASYADKYQSFVDSKHMSPLKEVKMLPYEESIGQYDYVFVEFEGSFYNFRTSYNWDSQSSWGYDMANSLYDLTSFSCPEEHFKERGRSYYGRELTNKKYIELFKGKAKRVKPVAILESNEVIPL